MSGLRAPTFLCGVSVQVVVLYAISKFLNLYGRSYSMANLKHDCPHCHARSATFTSFGERQHRENGNILSVIAFYCNLCDKGVFASFRNNRGMNINGNTGNVKKIGGVNIIDIYPIGSETSVPEHLPENIESFYKQAAESLRAGHYDASGVMSRKSLDVTTKILNPEEKGNLYKRIEKLSDKGIITPDLKDWAHIIRDDGNDAVHEEVPTTKESAEELLSFTEVFLMYSFTMPKMVENKRKEADEGGKFAVV